MKRALVTGGAGFIGSHLVDSLLADGWSVDVVDCFDPFYPRDVKERNIAPHRRVSNWSLIDVDIADADALRSAVRGTVDVIVHLAAKAGVRPSIEDPVGYQRANVVGTQNLLELARERGVRQFVFASSSSVYGVNPRVPWTESDRVLEPISPYAATKVSGELLGHVYSHLYGIRFLALRLFTVYGPRQRPDLAIHKFARLLMDGGAVPMYGDGTTRRDYTFVADIVFGIRAAMAYDRSNYEVVNLGNSRTVSLMEMVSSVAAALDTEPRVQRLPEQPGDVPQTWADVSRAGELLGYEPKTEFDLGVRAFVEWLRSVRATQP